MAGVFLIFVQLTDGKDIAEMGEDEIREHLEVV